MSHAEAVDLRSVERHPLAGATNSIVTFAGNVRWDRLDPAVQHAAKRHLLDTVGVMTAGAGGNVATSAEAALASVRRPGGTAVPGRARPADMHAPASRGRTAA